MTSRGNQHKRIYALYRGDIYIRYGTADELATETGLKVATILWYATGVRRRRIDSQRRKSKKSIIVEPIGWDDDDYD
ncbi:hypothetical protein ACLUXD_01920 [Loigolactobacillus coryniformis subsp. coryniformis]|uniref:hypothetical protein n=1 Tax=Loigolactobacillus coryniformis TaxID=1610 RepID=UPI0039941A50